MLLEAIYHKPYSEYAFPLDENTLVIRLRAKKGDLKQVFLYYHDKYDARQQGVAEMKITAEDELFDYFQASIRCGIKRFKYMFRLDDGASAWWLNASGFCDYQPEWSHFSYSNISRGDIPSIPGWWKNAVVYQIFPDRFHNPGKTGAKAASQAFGGTLQGILEKIGYLKGLGVNTLYLNPIFKAGSYHRYDCIDYFDVDPSLGGKDALRRLVSACRQLGMKIILDAVFNHCSSDFFAFQEVMQNGSRARYKDWFLIRSFPVRTYPKPNYECFAAFGGMPKLNTGNPEVRDYLIQAAVYWIKEFDIDGWRFDVADEIDRDFWRKLRDAVRETKEEAVVLGEIWDEASSWLNTQTFDTVINYPLKAFINDLIAYNCADAEKFRQKYDGYRMNFSHEAERRLLNIIGTHDTPRFLTLCGQQRKRFLLGALLQFTMPGVPMVYYGDEIGMTGEGDPDCRKPMPWEEVEWDQDISRFYRFLIRLRQKYDSLAQGPLEWAGREEMGDILAFWRETGNEKILVLINPTGKAAEFSIPWKGNILGAMDMENHEILPLIQGELRGRMDAYGWHVFGAGVEMEDNLV